MRKGLLVMSITGVAIGAAVAAGAGGSQAPILLSPPSREESRNAVARKAEVDSAHG